MSSLDYYNTNAQAFYERTINANIGDERDKFLAQINPLPVNSMAKILDAGCGVGRDACYFEQIGYEVTAFDGSIEMVKLANQLLARPATQMLFKDMRYNEEFEGVWAAASLLHVPPKELGDVLQKIYQALKRDGVFFASFKHGEGEHTYEGRTFYYMNDPTIRTCLSPYFKIIDIWTKEDRTSKVAPSPDKTWLNVLVKKI